MELQSLNFLKRAQFFVNAVPDEKEEDWADHLRGAAKMLGEKYPLKTGLSGVIEGAYRLEDCLLLQPLLFVSCLRCVKSTVFI